MFDHNSSTSFTAVAQRWDDGRKATKRWEDEVRAPWTKEACPKNPESKKRSRHLWVPIESQSRFVPHLVKHGSPLFQGCDVRDAPFANTLPTAYPLSRK